MFVVVASPFLLSEHFMVASIEHPSNSTTNAFLCTLLYFVWTFLPPKVAGLQLHVHSTLYMLTAPTSNLSGQKNGCLYRMNLTDTLRTEVGWQFPCCCCCCCLFVCFSWGWGRETANITTLMKQS